MTTKYRLLIVRHGKSILNHDSKFIGWTNIQISDKCVLEAYNTLINKY